MSAGELVPDALTINMLSQELEKKADETWGGNPEYEEYKNSTPVLFPKLFS